MKIRIDRFTWEELEAAKNADLCQVAEELGYTVKRVGSFYTIKEMDSIRIYHRKSWCRFSKLYDNSGKGGSTIDFLKEFAGLDVKEAVAWLLDFIGDTSFQERKQQREKPVVALEEKKKTEKKPLVLPEPTGDNYFLYSYLQKKRAIRKEVIDFFVNTGLLYEEKKYHNLVFLGKDIKGIVRFASMRGVFDRNGVVFKCDVAGSDKTYGFHIFRENSVQVVVMEAAIDVMSYIDLFPKEKHSFLALGMLSDAPLQTFLSEYPEIQKIQFCLDNDVAGRMATEKLMKKYKELGYVVKDKPPPSQYKDYNEWLQEKRKECLKVQEKSYGRKSLSSR